MTTLEEVMEDVQATMQRMIDDTARQAEKDNTHKMQMWMIGDCYEQMAAEKVANLELLHSEWRA